jgi:hypothetical protein
MSVRAKRTSRTRGVSVVLGTRDHGLLRAVGRFRLATSADLHRLFFAGRHRDVVAARLRKLYDAGFLETHMLDRAAPNIYSLGPVAKAWLRAQGGTVHGLPRPPWQHHLGVISLWSRVAAATHQLGCVRLARFVPEFEVREQGVGVGSGVVPDALLELGVVRDGRSETVRMLVELDRGNEALTVVRQKLRALAVVRAEGSLLPEWTTFDLVVALDEAGARREAKVRALVAEEWSGPWHVWMDSTDLVAELGRLGGPSEATVRGSRLGNGSGPAASADGAVLPAVTGGGLSDDS